MGDTLDGLTDAPSHTVSVSAFYMQKNEVINAEWDAVRAWGLNNGYTDLPAGNGSYASKGTNYPVHSVSWHDAVKWCNAKSEMDGLTPCYYTDAAQSSLFRTGTNTLGNAMVKWTANGYRLPTEAEWEKAARGGLAGNRFPWGDTINHSNTNYRANSIANTYDTSGYTTNTYHPTYYTPGSFPFTSPVGSFVANGYGLNDMAGNLGELCSDCYSSDYYSSSPRTDPRGPDTGAQSL